jgi:hypothetical protein
MLATTEMEMLRSTFEKPECAPCFSSQFICGAQAAPVATRNINIAEKAAASNKKDSSHANCTG